MAPKKTSATRSVRSFAHVGLLVGMVLVISILALAVCVLESL